MLVRCLVNTVKKFRETGNLKNIYKNKLDKTCFTYDAAYSDNKDLPERTATDRILKDRAYKIAINPKHDGHQRRLQAWSINVLTKTQDRKWGEQE